MSSNVARPLLTDSNGVFYQSANIDGTYTFFGSETDGKEGTYDILFYCMEEEAMEERCKTIVNEYKYWYVSRGYWHKHKKTKY